MLARGTSILRIGAVDTPGHDRVAQILVQIARRKDIPEHLPLGVNVAASSIGADRKLLDDDLTWRLVGRSADCGEPYPAQFPLDLSD
jgi:hypothetical protein